MMKVHDGGAMTEANYPAFAYILRWVPQGSVKLWKVGACRRAGQEQVAIGAMKKRVRAIRVCPQGLKVDCAGRWELYAVWGIRGKGQRAARNAVFMEAILLGEAAKSYKMWVADNGQDSRPRLKLRSTDYATGVDQTTVDQWIANATSAAAGFPADVKIEGLSADVVVRVNARRPTSTQGPRRER